MPRLESRPESWYFEDVKPTIVFIHGLNTYADGLVHVGPLKFGAMKDKWEVALRRRGFDFVGVRGMGYGPIEEQADRALEHLRTEGYLDGRRELVLLGHSLGGLVARALATRPEARAQTKAIFTFGSPHGGAHVTDVALSLDEKSPALHKFLQVVGYDVSKKKAAFSNFTRANIDEFNRRHPLPTGVRCVSLLCEVKGLEISWPLVPVYAKLRAVDPEPLGDGFISSKSQRWGESVGSFGVDHFGEMGYFFHLSPTNRARARREFERLTATVAKLAVGDTV